MVWSYLYISDMYIYSYQVCMSVQTIIHGGADAKYCHSKCMIHAHFPETLQRIWKTCLTCWISSPLLGTLMSIWAMLKITSVTIFMILDTLNWLSPKESSITLWKVPLGKIARQPALVWPWVLSGTWCYVLIFPTRCFRTAIEFHCEGTL